LLFVPDLFLYNRRKTRVVMVGEVGVGAITHPPAVHDHHAYHGRRRHRGPIHPHDRSGFRIVRITAPKMADARALGEIRKKLNAKGYSKVPLVADIHFNPECAMEAPITWKKCV